MQKPNVPFRVQPSSGIPIYRQIMDQARALIAGSGLPAGSLLPSVRDTAAALEINMMTVSKAYARLEAEGVLERVRGTGMRVKSSAANEVVRERQRQLRSQLEHAVRLGQQLQLSDEQILAVVRSLLRERKQ